VNNLYWALIGIVSLAVAAALILHFSLKAQERLDQLSNIEMATFLRYIYTRTLDNQISDTLRQLSVRQLSNQLFDMDRKPFKIFAHA
jgi:hypothetical protein